MKLISWGMALLPTTRRWMPTASLLLLLLGGIMGLILTRDSGEFAQPRSRYANLVDQRPLQTARSMAGLVSSRDEQRYARQSLKIADHAVDLAFSVALRDAAKQQSDQNPQSREAYARMNKAQAAVKADQDRIDQKKRQLGAGSAEHQDKLQQEISLEQAQLELDQDELEDAQDDLARAGADTQRRIQRLFERHQTDEQGIEALLAQNANKIDAGPVAPNLIAQIGTWRTAENKEAQLKQAQNEAQTTADSVQGARDALQRRVASEAPSKEALAQQARAQLSTAETQGPASAAGAATATIASLRRFADDQKDLQDLTRETQDEKDLADVYASWIAVVQARKLAAIHGILRALLWIVLIVLLVYEAGMVADRLFFADLPPEQRRLRTLRVIVRFALQAVGLLAIVLVVMGTPADLPTVLGLAGAGLTVALKDFIVAFVGWFVLMGRNGIRVGDWVEINGVVGEVAEINLLRTVLLETGNWTDTGHPTGRKVAFVNSYAIEGHFFNFSTAGQWLWDEIEFMVPATEDPYPVIAEIQQMVTKETETAARAAEQEWQQAGNQYRVKAVSAAPAVNLRPTTAGVEVHVRYITRAQERFATRTRLYQALVDLFHQKRMPEAAEIAMAGKK